MIGKWIGMMRVIMIVPMFMVMRVQRRPRQPVLLAKILIAT